MRLATGLILASVIGTAIAIGSSSANAGANTDKKGAPWFSPGRAGRAVSPLTDPRAAMTLGKQVFVAQCVACHGTSGRGDGPLGKTLESTPGDLTKSLHWVSSDGSLFFKISKGRAPMPAFETLISEKDRWSVLAYLRSLSTEPDHVQATAPASAPTRKMISKTLQQYDRLVMSWLTGNQTFIDRQLGKVGDALATLATDGENSLTGDSQATFLTLIETATTGLEKINSDPADSASRLDGFADLSRALIDLVESYGHTQKRGVSILESSGNQWLQLEGPAWSPYGGDRDDVHVRHFVDPVD